ncbi:MAG: HAD-IIIC family phosphatase [Paludibacter sp.]|nr:HAD-IIIC family phosphatase [Paludibacter sp.]
MDFDKIKLVIWDLDNTFWSGIISEAEIQPITKNMEMVVSLTDCGIINSICSKNTYEVAADKLKELEVFDFFVFPSIDWSPKGQRIRNLIKTMSLRAENVLFLDDDITNLEEAKHYSPEIMVGGPEVFSDLYKFVAASEKKDLEHTRLDNYKLLEKKEIEQKKYDSNEDFLYASNIKVGIIEDCIPEMERIHDLLMRSNQLNYTKKRIPKEELKALLENKNATCAYIVVNDKFGNYGIIGFYAVLNARLEHFLFSCRTIGLGIEQYVYSKLNYPKLEVVGDVVSNVNETKAPLWINKKNTAGNINVNTATENTISGNAKFLFKSACDFSQVIGYIKNNDLFRCEFNYVSTARGNVIEGHNHSVHISRLKDITASQKQEILNDCVFVDEEMFKGSIYNNKYDMVFLSSFSESYAGIYRKKNSDIEVTVGSHLYPLTDKTYWEGLINGTLYSGKNEFTEEYLTEFSNKYEFVGFTTPDDYRKRIDKIVENLDFKTKLCLILGVEFPCEKNTEPFYKDRHLMHARLNKKIREMARENPRLIVFDLNKIVKNQNDFTDNLNQFTPQVNFEISQRMISIINASVSTKIEHYHTLFIYFDILLKYTKEFAKQIIPRENGVYSNLQSFYYRLSRKRR